MWGHAGGRGRLGQIGPVSNRQPGARATPSRQGDCNPLTDSARAARLRFAAESMKRMPPVAEPSDVRHNLDALAFPSGNA